MDIIVDTQTFIWFCEGNEKLPNKIRDIIGKKENDIKVSIASLWEMTIKMSIEKLVLSWSITEIMNLLFENGFKILPIEAKHLISLFGLKYIHRDPFDRMIIAQSISENIPVISSDGIFKEYPVQVIW
jgi:PIN domain nuclease of toxin-antitoxin system